MVVSERPARSGRHAGGNIGLLFVPPKKYENEDSALSPTPYPSIIMQEDHRKGSGPRLAFTSERKSGSFQGPAPSADASTAERDNKF